MNPKVSIILLNWNSGEFIEACIESLQRLTYLNYEIIVVDNASSDGSDDILKVRYPNIVLLENTVNLGFAGGNNIGINYALEHGTDYVLILNSDTVVDKQLVGEMISVASQDKQIGMVTCKMLYYDEPERLWYAGGEINKLTLWSRHIGHYKIDSQRYSNIREISFVTGCCMLVRRSLIEKIGMFDEIFFTYSEDVDWSLRARKAGFKLMYVPTSKLWHKVGGIIRKNTRTGVEGSSSPYQYYQTTRNHFLILRKHGNLFNIIFGGIILILRIFYTAAGLFILCRWNKLSALSKGIRDGIQTPI